MEDLLHYAATNDITVAKTFQEHISGGKENPYLTIMCAVLGTAAELERETIYYRLKSGQSVRNTAKITGISQNTVQRVKKEFAL